MVREEQHLCGPSDLSEDTEACLSAPFVEVHAEVVGEERQADPSRDRLLPRGSPQRVEKLVGGALAPLVILAHAPLLFAHTPLSPSLIFFFYLSLFLSPPFFRLSYLPLFFFFFFCFFF